MSRMILINHNNRPLDAVDDYVKEDFQRELFYHDKIYENLRPLGFSFSCASGPSGDVGIDGVIADTQYAGEEELPPETRLFMTGVELTGDNMDIRNIDPEIVEFISNWKKNRIITYQQLVARFPELNNNLGYMDLKPYELGGENAKSEVK